MDGHKFLHSDSSMLMSNSLLDLPELLAVAPVVCWAAESSAGLGGR